jgi:hypothetical protein
MALAQIARGARAALETLDASGEHEAMWEFHALHGWVQGELDRSLRGKSPRESDRRLLRLLEIESV